MELIYFIFNAFVVCAIALPYRSRTVNTGDTINHSETAQDQTQDLRGKRQFNYAVPVLSSNLNNYGLLEEEYFNQEPSAKPSQSIYFQQPPQYFQRSAGYSNTPTRNFQDLPSTASNFWPKVNQQPFQSQQYTRPLDNSNRSPNLQGRAFGPDAFQEEQFLTRENINRRGIASLNYDQTSQPKYFQNQFSKLNQNPQPFHDSSSAITPRNYVWNEAPTVQTIQPQDSFSRQFSGNTPISFNNQLPPIKFSNKNSLPSFVPNNFQGEFSPSIQTFNREPFFFPTASSRTFNQDNPVQAALIYYDTGNNNHRISNANQQLNNPNIRQIIPSPQELFNTALSIGSNIIEKVPGYKLTTNTIGLLANITRYGTGFFGSNTLPAFGPSSNRPNPLFPYQNRPSSPLVHKKPRPTTSIYYTTTPIPIQVEIITNPTLGMHEISVPNTPIVAADDPSSYENSGQLRPDTENHRDSHESGGSSQQYGSHENQSSSQESADTTNKLTNGNRIQTQSPQGAPHTSTSEEDNSGPTDYNSPAVAGDVLPDEDYGINDDDDKIDTKAIKSVLG